MKNIERKINNGKVMEFRLFFILNSVFLILH